MVTVAPASAVPDKVEPLEVLIVGVVGTAIAVAELVLPALSVTVMEPVWPSDSGLSMLQLPLPSAVVVARTVVPSAA